LWRHSSESRNQLRLWWSIKIGNCWFHCFQQAHLILKSTCLKLSFGRGDSLGNFSNQLWTFNSLISHLVWLLTIKWNSVRSSCSLTNWRGNSSSEERLLVLVDLLMHLSISKIINYMNGHTCTLNVIEFIENIDICLNI
jgi:hypothetical protein